jgi:hypothetical protein
VVEDLGNWSYNKLFLNKKKWDGSLKMREELTLIM